MPLRPSEGPACQVRCLEGRARRVRLLTFDHPFRFAGHDERAPPRLWRDALVASAAQRWIIHPDSSGMMGIPPILGGLHTHYFTVVRRRPVWSETNIFVMLCIR